MKYRTSMMAILATLLVSPILGNDSEIKNTVRFHQLSLASALEGAQESIKKCREDSQHVTATVVDRHGLVQVALRDTHATAISLELSRKKAYTAANFSKDTTQLADLSDTAVGRSAGILMSAGGVIVVVDDVIYGAVGVSGSSSGAKDDQCARAGVQRLVNAITSDKEDEQRLIETIKDQKGK